MATAFELDLDNVESLSIVDARNIMHKVSSKMQEPKILMDIQTKCAGLESEFPRKYIAASQNNLQ